MKYYSILCCFIFLFFSGCADIKVVEVEIPSGYPKINENELNEALRKLGVMAEIYGVHAHIMIDKIDDNTGSAQHTQAEIPYDITRMTLTALNSIGKNIVFVPYRPDIVANLKNLGYFSFDNKQIPTAMIMGGITEFDRGLETKENSMNLGYNISRFSLKPPSGFDYMQGKKESRARITIDYNMIDISRMTGIPGVHTSNSMEVHKGIGSTELAFTILGPSFGLKGESKKVEGRHAALRMLVQSSIIQLIGKHLELPYWRLIPETPQDDFIVSNLEKSWNSQWGEKERISKLQELLFLHGYEEIIPTGVFNKETFDALEKFSESSSTPKEIDFSLYSSLYFSLPLEQKTVERRNKLIHIDQELSLNKKKTEQDQDPNQVDPETKADDEK
jgi:hypothetical protein